MAQPISMGTRGLDSKIGGGGGGEGKIEGRHILIIAMSEHYVDYMNRKGLSLRYYAGGTFSPMCTSDSMDSCMAPGFWQTLNSIAEVRRDCSEI